MQINGITRQLLAPLQLDTANAARTDGAAAGASSSGASDDAGLVVGRAFHEILARYDVTDISPREFSNLIQELHESGEIDDAEFRELARMRLELEQAGYDPDERLSLVDFFEQKLSDRAGEFAAARDQATPDVAATLEPGAFTAESQRQLDWIHKFALVQAAGAAGVDVGA